MKKIVLEFLCRGMVACGLGPIILAVLYLILQYQGIIEILTVNEVCIGIFSLAVLAFVAGGMNVVYQIERLPLMVAILIHGAVLYITYLVTYLLNNWLEWEVNPILVFTGIFMFGYLVIWIIICFIIKSRTERLNEKLKKKQQYVKKDIY